MFKPKWKDPPPFGRMVLYQGQRFFYHLDNRLHFKGFYNDTVYTYNRTNKIEPKFSINLGKYKLPEEMIIERGLVRQIPPDYLWVSVNESSDYVFIYFCSYDSEDPGAGFMVYDKKSRTGTTLKSDDGKRILFNSIGDWGFINDYDGGPELIPVFANDSLLYRLISPIEMKKHLTSDEFINSSPVDSTHKRVLINQMSDLKETDNDILMIAKLK